MRIASLIKGWIKGWVLLVVGLGLPIAAQTASEPVYVPLMIKVKGTLDSTTTRQGTVYANPATASIVASLDGDPVPPVVTGTFGSDYKLSFPVQILPIEMGREGNLTISSTNSSASSFTITPPPGYTVLINGLVRKTKNVSGSGVFQIRVLPALDSTPAPAGTATGFSPGQVKWGVSLGSEKNGQSIGWLWMIGAGVSDWGNFFKPAYLYCEQDSDELTVHKITVDGVANIKRQIRTNEAFVDLITPTTPAASNVPALSGDAKLEIRFYHPTSMTTSGSLRTPLTNKQPFLIYRVFDTPSGSTKGMRIEKQVCALGDSPAPVVLRTEYTTLTRTGTSLTSYTWTATDWTLAGELPLSSAVATWESIPGITEGHREVAEVRDMTTGGTVVARTSTDHVATLPGLARMPVTTVVAPGAADSVTSSVAYYADALANGSPDPAKRYRRGFPQISSSTGGAWSAVKYVDPDTREPAIPSGDKDEWLGLVDTSFSPWLDTAAPALATNAEPAIGIGMIASRLDYTKDVFGYPSRVTLAETYYRGENASDTLISKTTTVYTNTSAMGRSAIDAEISNHVGDGRTVKQYRVYFREDDSKSFWRNQLFKDTSSSGLKISYLRERGEFTTAVADTDTPLGFNAGTSGAASRIGVITGSFSDYPSEDTESTLTTHYDGGDISDVYLIPGRSTLSLTYRDAYARVVRTESFLRTTSATWQLVAWENFTYNTRNQVTLRKSSNGDTHELFYTGEYLTREVDAMGVETIYDYDIAGRMWKSIRSAFGSLPALVTESVFDAADRVVEQRTYAADNPGLKSVTTRTYDLAGRVVSEKSSGSPAVTTTYNPAARTTTVTNSATFATKTNETYLDGQPKSVTGTGVVEERYAYAFESDGRRRTEATSGPVGSLRTVKSWSDWLGRNTSTKRPSPTGEADVFAISETIYDDYTGLPIRGTSSGSAPTLTVYDRMGEPKLTGLDAEINTTNNTSTPSGALEPASARDRITGTRKSAVFSDNAWWATSESYTYATAGSATETILSKSWTRLTGLTGGLVGETRSWDAEGNLTRRTVERDRATRTVTTRTWLPGIANPQVDVAIDGLAVTSTAPDGLVATTGYDSLRRPVTSTTPRSGDAGGTRQLTTTYELDGTEATGLVKTVTDSENRTSTTVYDTAFRPATTINSDGKSVSQAFNTRGQVTHVYGTATSPVRYVYDADYGQRVEQHTFRDAVHSAYANLSEFPVATAPEVDRVVWTHDPATGLLLKKTDPLERFVQYTYDVAGRIATRQWARHKTPGVTTEPATDADRLTATPVYDAATGDLLSTAYNDDGATPAVSTTYDRLGRPQTITDATGTRTFVRDTAKPWRTNAEQLPAFYGTGRQLSWLYEESSGTSGGNGYVLGRSRGFRLGTAAQPDALLEQTFARSDSGRLSGITSTHSAASTRNFAYTYTPNSRLVKSLTAPGTGYSLTRQWDPVRDLLTQIETTSGTHSLARYDYTHTTLGQRQTATQTGEAFAADATDPAQTTTTYAYNDRGEVESALTGVGNASTAPAALIPGRKFAFGYDLAGNRLKSTHQGDLNGSAATHYTVGKANQLTQRDNPVASVSGVIANTATVMAVDQAPLTAADRQGHHWQRDVTSPEKPARAVATDDGGSIDEYPRSARSLVTLASMLGAGTGGADLTAFDRRMLLMYPRDEQLRYDRDGNLLRDGTWDYTWDAENRLVRMETHWWLDDQDRKKLEFTYDYQGRRVSKRVQTWPVGASGYLPATETRFLYDGWNLIGEFTLNSQLSTLNLVRSYTWGLDLIGSLTASGGVGGLVQITDHADGQSYLPGYDGNGNVAVLVRASDGYRAAAYEYGPYGEVLRSEGTYAAQNTFRFSTKFTDVESGLVYYGMRYYDARNGRFINRDPIEERGGLNLYGFCGNDGVNRYDVLGMSWLSKAFKKLKKWMGKHQWVAQVIGAVAGFFTAGAGFFVSGILNGALGGLVGGVTSSTLMGGNIGQIATAGAWGALAGAVAGGIGDKFGPVGRGSKFDLGNEFRRALAHGVSQGAIGAARGQKFGAAFASGFFGSYAGSGLQASGAPWQIGIPLSGVVGGISSRIGGGRFEDGFASGLTVAAFNHYSESDERLMHPTNQTTPVPEWMESGRVDDATIDAAGFAAGFAPVVNRVFAATFGRALGWAGSKIGGFFGRSVGSSSQIVLREGDAVLAVVHEGKILASTKDISLSHAEFVSREIGTLPAGAEVVTIGKFQNDVVALLSRTFHDTQLPASMAAQEAARAAFH